MQQKKKYVEFSFFLLNTDKAEKKIKKFAETKKKKKINRNSVEREKN